METRKLELDARRIETGSKIASKGDQKDCAECGAPATVKDVRGYLELCSKHMKKKSSLQDKIAGLKVRLAAPFEVDRTEPNRSVYTVSSPSIGPNEVSGLISKYADRRADRPEMQGETQAGRWAMVVKHDDEGKPVTATLGRIGGSKIGGDAETSPLVCTGNTHHGINGKCEHSPDDAFGGRHIAVQETTAVPYSGTLMPDVANRREGSIFAPSHRVYVLPQEEHDKIEDTMNTIAKGGVSLPERGINIPPFKREEEGRGRLVETFERGRESSQSGHGINTEMGASHGVGKVSNFTIWPSTADFGHFENETGRSRGKGENVKEILENGPRDLKGSEKTNPNYGKLVAGQEGKAGSGRVLPVATMTPEYNNTDEKKGLSGALADGSSAGLGVTTRLRPVAWGNASDSPTFKFLQDTAGKAMGPVKAVGEALRKRLVDANNERKQRVGVERVQRSQTSTPTRAPSRSQVGTDVLRQLLGGE